MKSSDANPTATPENEARIFNIQRFSTEDGPGIRTTVFMKGCPLSCPWCHNPESIRNEFELVWHPARCIGDGACLKSCPLGALKRSDAGAIIIDRIKCTACGDCVEACPACALEIFGRFISLPRLIAEVEADRVFYETSGGGVTFSGGEPMQQGGFLASALEILKSKQIHTAVDTSALAPMDAIDAAAEFTDLFLVDLKIMDPDLHRKTVGVPLAPILENLIHIDRDLGKKIWIRTPLIPGYTASESNIRAIAEFIRDNLTHVERFDLLSFSNLAASKYHALDREWLLASTPLFSREQGEVFADLARTILPPDLVHLSGPMAVPDPSVGAASSRDPEGGDK